MAQVPIQTVIIETDSPYLGKGWPIWRTPRVPVVFRVRLGRRFAPEADHTGLLRQATRGVLRGTSMQPSMSRASADESQPRRRTPPAC